MDTLKLLAWYILNRKHTNDEIYELLDRAYEKGRMEERIKILTEKLEGKI